MPNQTLIPASDVSVTSWSPTPIFSNLQTSGGGSATSDLSSFAEPEFTLGMSAPSTPIPGTCTLTVICRRGGGAQAQDVFVEVTQGATSLASATFAGLLTTFETRTLSFASSLVSSWATQFRVLVKRLATVGAQQAEVDLVTLTVPPAGRSHLDVGANGLVVVGAASGNYLTLGASGIQRVSGGEVAGALIFDSTTGIKVWDGN